MAFDLKKLKPGDEVGIEQTWSDGTTSQVVVLVTAADPEGFEADCDWFDMDGRNLSYPDKRRLVPPTDEGRIVALRESIPIDLGILGSRSHGMSLEELKRLNEAVGELIGRFAAEDSG